jgi:hypothetical protein
MFVLNVNTALSKENTIFVTSACAEPVFQYTSTMLCFFNTALLMWDPFCTNFGDIFSMTLMYFGSVLQVECLLNRRYFSDAVTCLWASVALIKR